MFPDFNSIKVRLKRLIVHFSCCIHIHFNSIKVRLKRQAIRACLLYLAFQFHKGTIKTGDEAAVALTPNKFQFHKGTIKTYDGGFNDAYSDISIP